MSYPRPGVYSSHAKDRLPSIRKMKEEIKAGDPFERGNAGSIIMDCPKCKGVHFRIDPKDQYCVACSYYGRGDIRLQPRLKK